MPSYHKKWEHVSNSPTVGKSPRVLQNSDVESSIMLSLPFFFPFAVLTCSSTISFFFGLLSTSCAIWKKKGIYSKTDVHRWPKELHYIAKKFPDKSWCHMAFFYVAIPKLGDHSSYICCLKEKNPKLISIMVNNLHEYASQF